MSIEWIQRLSRCQPMNEQELSVADVLNVFGVEYEVHKVFDLGKLGFVSVDFFIDDEPPVVIECTYTASRQSKAVSELRRRAVWMDWKFAQLRRVMPDVVRIAFMEALKVDSTLLRASLSQLLAHADFVVPSLSKLGDLLARFVKM